MQAHSMIRQASLAVACIGLLASASNVLAQATGKDVYEQTCIACHGVDGTGVLPGIPDLTEPGGRLTKPEELLIEHTINGFQSPGSPMAMPPRGGNAALTEQDARAVVRYMIDAFGPR